MPFTPDDPANGAVVDLRDDFGKRLDALTFDFVSPFNGKTVRSLVVDDPVGKRPTRLLFGPDRRVAPARSARNAG